MLSYTNRRDTFGDLANNSASATLTLADKLINIEEKRILSSYAWSFLEKQFTATTVASTQFTTLPQYIDRVSSVYVTVGTYRYTPRECPSREMWDRLNMTTVTSDIPTWWFVYDGKLGLFPTPSSSSNTITINSKQSAKDLTVADYTTGSIVTMVNGSPTVTGTGTTFTASMVGRWLRITETNAANGGDGFWYQILAYTSATVITLVRNYAGTAITAGTVAYTISQCSLIPEQYQDLPIYGALRTYFTSVSPDNSKAQLYGGMYKEMLATMEADYSVKNQSCVIDDGTGYDYQQSNPNLFITL